jgi:hypothetical protein
MRYFFILALGRSGTNFLARLLDHDRRGTVRHETYPLDPRLIVLRRVGSYSQSLDHLLDVRFKDRVPAEGEFYGEVNSYLRYEADWLRKRFDPVLIHLVRDGRAFVRSANIRGVYTPYEMDGPILPRDDDPYASQWAGMNRFERLCWYWMHTNEHLAAGVERCVRLEDLLADYEVLRREVLEPTGLRIDEATWRREVDRPKNTSRIYKLRLAAARLRRGRRSVPTFEPLPHWSQWDESMTRRFEEICGPTMRRLGYEL